MLMGQQHKVDNPSLRQFSQVILGSIKLKIKTNHHRSPRFKYLPQ